MLSTVTTDQIRAHALNILHDELLTVKEYAHATRLNPEYIREQCRRGRMKGALRIGGQWRIRFTVTPCNS